MRIKIIFKYLSFAIFTFINVPHVLIASQHIDNNINWFGLGEVYSHKPALGWLLFTFFIFVLILCYLCNKIILSMFINRSDMIKKKIFNVRKMTAISNKKLANYNKKITSLDNELNAMFQKFVYKKKREQILLEIETIYIINQINKNLKNMIRSDIKQIKMNIKEKFINQIVNNVIQLIKTKPDLYSTDNHKELLIKKLLLLKIDI